MFCIDSKVLGTNKHLMVDSGFSWMSILPDNVWNLSNDIRIYDDWCLNSLLKLDQHEINLNPPSKFVKSMEIVASGSIHPWSLVMPSDAHRDFVKRLINEIEVALSDINKNYFCDVWRQGNSILRSLEPAKIDSKIFDQIVEGIGMNLRSIDGFKPDNRGYAKPVIYDRFGTRTGRLTVKSGPGILTLKKEYRDAISSSFDGGNIVSLDFSALEVRILLYENGLDCESDDLYEKISQDLFSGAFDRKAVKAAVIAESYGSSKATLQKFLNIPDVKLNDFIDKIKNYLGTKSIRDAASSFFWKNGYIQNKYGRKVAIEEPHGHIFVNSYAQSTGVDVSLMGFNSITKNLMNSPGVRPLFVIHDELLLDVSPERLDDVFSIKKIKIPGYSQDFYLRAKIVK